MLLSSTSSRWMFVLVCLVSFTAFVSGDDGASAQLFFEGLNETELVESIIVESTNVTTSNTTEDVVVATAIQDLEPISTTEILYDLPSFTLTLQIEKDERSNDNLLAFEEKMQDQIEWHLEEFFQSKLDAMESDEGNDDDTSFPSHRMIVQEIRLSSNLVWKELSTDITPTTTLASTVSSSEETESQTLAVEVANAQQSKSYEVRATFDCDLSFLLERYVDEGQQEISSSSPLSSLGISSTVMNLFLIEAFQGENYWDLVHRFLASEVLHEVHDVNIVVAVDGFKPYHHGQGEFQFDDDWYNSSSDPDISTGAIIGTAIATLLILVMIGSTLYICCVFPKWSLRRLFVDAGKTCNGASSIVDDKGSETDDACTNSSSSDGIEDDVESAGDLDAWANSITSIPLRDPTKDPRFHKKKRRGRPTVQSFIRPAHEAKSTLELECIDEADNETVTSSRTTESASSASVKTARTANKAKSQQTNLSSIGTITEDHEESTFSCSQTVSSSKTCAGSSSSSVSTSVSTRSRRRQNVSDRNGDDDDDVESMLSGVVTIWDDATSVTSEDNESSTLISV